MAFDGYSISGKHTKTHHYRRIHPFLLEQVIEAVDGAIEEVLPFVEHRFATFKGGGTIMSIEGFGGGVDYYHLQLDSMEPVGKEGAGD